MIIIILLVKLASTPITKVKVSLFVTMPHHAQSMYYLLCDVLLSLLALISMWNIYGIKVIFQVTKANEDQWQSLTHNYKHSSDNEINFNGDTQTCCVE